MIGKNKIQSLQKHSTMIMAMAFKSKIIYYMYYSIIVNCHTLFIKYFTVFFLIVPTLIFQAKSNHGYPQSVHWCTVCVVCSTNIPVSSQYLLIVHTFILYAYLKLNGGLGVKSFFSSTLCPNVNGLYLPTATFNANISLNLFGDRG